MSQSSGEKTAEGQLAEALADELSALSPEELGDGRRRHDLLKLGAKLIAGSKAEAVRRTAARERALDTLQRRLKSPQDTSDLADEELEE